MLDVLSLDVVEYTGRKTHRYHVASDKLHRSGMFQVTGGGMRDDGRLMTDEGRIYNLSLVTSLSLAT